MAIVAQYLIDTSAAARMNIGAVADRLTEIIDSGLVATTAVLDAEAPFSARNPRRPPHHRHPLRQ